MAKRYSLFSIFAVMILLFSSCKTAEKVVYFQDRDSINNFQMEVPKQVKLHPGDKIMIVVKCEDAQTSDLFNLAYASRLIGSSNKAFSGNTQGVLGYTIDSNGDIMFPTLGKLHVADMSREEVQRLITDQLSAQGQSQNAIVTVEYLDLSIQVLGEVRVPGKYSLNRDVVTIMDAISMAGDLTIDGCRDKIVVMRQNQDGSVTAYNLNLNSARELLSSPAYYLQQNDIVYVEPNKKKARSSTVNGNNILSASFWLSLASTAVTIFTFVLALNRNGK